MTRGSAVRAVLAVAALAVLAATLTACTNAPEPTPSPTPRAVTTAESQLLATTRFTNFDTGSRPFRVTLLVDGAELALQGWVDYGSHLGYAAVTGDFDPQALLWDESTVGIISGTPDADGNPTLPIPEPSDQAWQSHPLDPSTSDLDAVLTTLSNLGSDRPDNPLLLQQSGALWLRDDEVDDTSVTVFAAPPSDEPITDGALPAPDASPLRLWVAADSLMLRADLRIDNRWTPVELPDEPAPRLTFPGGQG